VADFYIDGAFDTTCAKGEAPPGFEPGIADLQSAGQSAQPPSGQTTSGKRARRGDRAPTKPNETDPDLARIFDAWPALPEPVRRAMLALAETALIGR